MPPKNRANKKNGSLPQPVAGGGAQVNPQVDGPDCERQPGEVEHQVQPPVVDEDQEQPPVVVAAASQQQQLVALAGVQGPPPVALAGVQGQQPVQVYTPNFYGGLSKKSSVAQVSPNVLQAMMFLPSLTGITLFEKPKSSQEEPKCDWGLCGAAKKVVPKDECRFHHSPKDPTGPISCILGDMKIFKKKELHNLEQKLPELLGDAEMPLIDFFSVRGSAKAKKEKLTKKGQSPFPLPFPLVDALLTEKKKITVESFIQLFNLDGKKTEARDAENRRIFSYFLVKYIESRPQNEFPDRCATVDDMKLFHLLKLLGSLNENLFAQSKTGLNCLALKLLIEVGANAPALAFDSGNDLGKVCMAMLIFKHIVSNEENDSSLSLQLFRALRECLDKENESFVKFCFDDDDDLKRFNLQLTFASAGAAHNSVLSCGAGNSKMINLREAYKEVFTSLHTIFWWKSPTGSGKSAAMFLSGTSLAAKNGWNFIYIGPETGTVDPMAIETMCEVIRMHFKNEGLECPRFNIIQSGAIPTKSSSTQAAVNIYLMNHFSDCLPLLYASSKSNYIVGFDDNNEILPCNVINILRRFKNVKQIHISGATLNMTGFDGISICEIGEGLENTVSSINATFIHDGISFSPDQIRLFRNYRLKMIRGFLKQFGCFLLPHWFEIKELCQEYQKKSQPLLDCLGTFDFLSRVSGKEPSCSLQNFIVLMKHLSFDPPPYQLGKLYSTEELALMSIPAVRVVDVLQDMGFEFKETSLQFPKDASASESQELLREEILKLRNKKSSPIFMFDLEKQAHEFASCAEKFSLQLNLSIKSSGGGVLSSDHESSTVHQGKHKKRDSADADGDAADAGHGFSSEPSNFSDDAPQKVIKKEAISTLKSKDKKDKVSSGAADNGANDAEDVAAAEADAAAEPDAADVASAEADASASADDVTLTFKDKLKRLAKELQNKMTLARVGIPTNKDVEEALEILLANEHPDAIRWLRQFILGICLFDKIMPPKFILICYKMFENGRMGMFLAREIFHVQSWNPDCILMISIIVCSAVPSRFLFQTIARAGRIGTQKSGQIKSLVSSIIRPELKQFSQDDFSVVLPPGQNFQSVVDVLTNMVESRLFTDRDRKWVVRFLEIFMFAYKDPACKLACEGGHLYMEDFMKLLSGALTSSFVSPFNCSFDRLAEELKRIAISDYISLSRKLLEKECNAFAEGMKAVVGQKALMMSLGLIRALMQNKPIGINVFDLILCFRELYEGYPNSFMHLLKCIKTLLMNAQTTKSFLEEDAMISSMLLVISNTIEFVSNILGFLSNLLREKDMERFRVGVVQSVNPMDELKAMFQMPVQPTLQELHAFLSRHQINLPGLWTLFCDLEAYLSPHPSGPYHDRNCRLRSLQQTFAGCKAQMVVEEKRKNTRPDGMNMRQFAAHQTTSDYISMCQEADATIGVLSKQCQELKGEIDHLSRELGTLPHQITGIVPYIKNLI